MARALRDQPLPERKRITVAAFDQFAGILTNPGSSR